MTTAIAPPGPRGHWLLGNLREFRRDMLAFYTRLARDYGDVARYRLGPYRLVLVTHPELIEQVLVTGNRHFIKHYALKLLAPTLGNGLVTSDGDFWLRQRRLIQPAFSRQRVESYAGIMVEHTQRMLAGWRDGETRDLHAEMMQLALGIVSKTLLDVDAGESYADVSASIDVILNDFDERFQSLWPFPFWLPVRSNRRLHKAVGKLEAILETIIQQRRSETSDRGDLLGALVRARDEQDQTGMTDRQLRDEVMTLFLAGHETTANALAWTWFLLATHPQVEAQVLTELNSVLGNRLPTAADVPLLTVTASILKESMRLYPPVYAFGREATRDVTLGKTNVPAGTAIIFSQWVNHRDERYFPQGDKFLPERWTPEFEKQLPKYAYFPFGGGPRTCIGNTFAMLEATLVLATILPRYRFELINPEPVVPWASVTLRPRNGVHCRVVRRTSDRES